MQEPTQLGKCFEIANKCTGIFRALFFFALVALIALNAVILPHEAEFGADSYPGFWAAYALAASIVMIFVLKKIVYPMLARPEKEESDERQ